MGVPFPPVPRGGFFGVANRFCAAYAGDPVWSSHVLPRKRENGLSFAPDASQPRPSGAALLSLIPLLSDFPDAHLRMALGVRISPPLLARAPSSDLRRASVLCVRFPPRVVWGSAWIPPILRALLFAFLVFAGVGRRVSRQIRMRAGLIPL